MKMRNNIILFVLAIILVLLVINVRYCERKHPVETNDVIKVQEAKKETIKAKIVIEEKKVTRVKEQKATIKKSLQVAKEGLILEVDAIINDTAKIEQVIDVIEKQGLIISTDSTIIALQDTIIDHYKQLDSNNTNIITELKEDSKKEVKKAKKRAFKNGIVTGASFVAVIVALFAMVFK